MTEYRQHRYSRSERQQPDDGAEPADRPFRLGGSILQGFDIRDPKNPVFHGYTDGVKLKLRDYHANEFSGFFKDKWKIRPALTLNLGVHYDWFGVPYEGNGLAGKPVGGDRGLCGISCGSLTTVEFVGKNSPNPTSNSTTTIGTTSLLLSV